MKKINNQNGAVFITPKSNSLNWILCFEFFVLTSTIAIQVNPNAIILCALKAQCTFLVSTTFCIAKLKTIPPKPDPAEPIPPASTLFFLKNCGKIVIVGIEINAKPKLCINPWVKYNCQSFVDQLANIKEAN